MIDYQEIGNNIKICRIRCNLKQAELAEMVGVKYTKEAGSLCRGRGFLLVNFLTALSDIQPCFSPWVRTPKPLTSISSSTGIVRYLHPSITRVSSR